MDKSVFDHYKDRENTKINLVIYGSFGFSAFALYLLAGSEHSNIFIAMLFITSLIFALAAFYYWYAADYMAYAEHEYNVLKQAPPENLRQFQQETAFLCFINILASYSIGFVATLLSFTKHFIFRIELLNLEIACWTILICVLFFFFSKLIKHFKRMFELLP